MLRARGRPGHLTAAVVASLALGVQLPASAQDGWSAPGAPTYSVEATRNAVWLRGTDAQPMVNLLPTLRIRHGRGRGRGRAVTLAATEPIQNPDGWRIFASAKLATARIDYEASARRGDPRIRVSIDIEYTRATEVRSESAEFQVSDVGKGLALDRAYRVRPIVAPAFAGPMTPKLGFFGAGSRAFALLGGRGVQGAWFEPSDAHAFVVKLELDHESNHPLQIYSNCVDRLVEVKTRSMNTTRRRAGERARLEAQFIVGDVSPVRTSRFPHGYRAAISFTDHADQSNTEKLEAFAFGRAGAVAAGEIGPKWPGFVNRGLRYTKSIFLEKTREYDRQYDDRGYRRILQMLVDQGIDVGLHSPTGWKDDRAKTSRLLAHLVSGGFQPRTWIDHQPQTNCEAIANQGWNAASPWYVFDLLQKHGLRTLWAVHDVRLPKRSINMLAPGRPGSRRPTIFAHPAFPGAHLFNSSWWYFKARERFYRLFRGAHLDGLEAEWGVAIGHTYLDTFRTRGKLRDRTLLERVDGEIMLRPEADAVFKELGRRHANGRTWVTGIDPLVQHMTTSLAVEVDYLPYGEALVRAPPDRRIQGLTLLLPSQFDDALLDGAPVELPRRLNGHLAVTIDVAAGGHRRVAGKRGGSRVPFLRPAHVVLARPR